jgi:hypothetical protein
MTQTVAVADRTSDDVSVLLGGAGARFSAPTCSRPATFPKRWRRGLQRRRHADLGVGSLTPDAVSVWLNNRGQRGRGGAVGRDIPPEPWGP